MTTIDILCINIRGQAELLVSDHQSAKTAYRKIPIKSASVYLTMEGLDGDMVNNKKYHGGNDKALCCYHSGHFAYWKQQLGFSLDAAAFGENLTLTGENAHESRVFIGDRYQLGQAIVEVSEPRGPCHMIGIRYNYKKFPLHLQETGFTGFYLRTLQTGMVNTGDQLVHISSHPAKISVMDVNRIRYHDPQNKEQLQRMVNLQELSINWRERFERILVKL